MRQAFQRCSARVSQSLRGSGISRQLALQSDWLLDLKDVQKPGVAVPTGRRRMHTRSALQQAGAAAQRTYEEDVPPPTNFITKFHELETKDVVHRNVVRTLTRDMGLETMTEVQTATINQALLGNDIIAQAKTGTGKTLAFLIPLLQNILKQDPDLAKQQFGRRGPRTTADDIRALIISPTRELAEQIAEEAKRLVKNTGVLVQTAVGGTQKSLGLRRIQREGCHILVGTPGRLKDILTDPYSRVEAPDLSALVFDEADRLLDQGFWPEIQEIMRLLPTPAQKDRQTLMFSATVPREVVDLVRATLKPGFDFVKCVRDDEEPTHERVPQRVISATGFENLTPALVELCYNAIEKSKQPDARPFKAIVYYNSTAEVTLASHVLRNLSEPSESGADAFGRRRPPHLWPRTEILEIHSRLTQSQRTQASDTFRHASSAILLSSDVTARGMDFPNVTHVIQIGLPNSRDQYIHRIGRTARAGKEGEGWLIINELEQPELRYRLNKLPIKADTSVKTANVDLSNPTNLSESSNRALQITTNAFKDVPRSEKAKAYKAAIGVYAWVRSKKDFVASLNRMAKFLWGMEAPPFVSRGLATKLGLIRIPGINIGEEAYDDGPLASRSGGSMGFGGSRTGGGFNRDSGRGGSFGGRSREGGFAARSRDGGSGFAGRAREGGSFAGSRDGGFAGRRDGGFAGSDRPGRYSGSPSGGSGFARTERTGGFNAGRPWDARSEGRADRRLSKEFKF